MAITKEEYFQDLAAMFIAGNGVFSDSEPNELWFDVTDINGKDLRYVIDKLNAALKADGLVSKSCIYGMGEGHLWFTDKAMREIEQLRTAKSDNPP